MPLKFKLSRSVSLAEQAALAARENPSRIVESKLFFESRVQELLAACAIPPYISPHVAPDQTAWRENYLTSDNRIVKLGWTSRKAKPSKEDSGKFVRENLQRKSITVVNADGTAVGINREGTATVICTAPLIELFTPHQFAKFVSTTEAGLTLGETIGTPTQELDSGLWCVRATFTHFSPKAQVQIKTSLQFAPLMGKATLERSA